jgi:pseudaminic acid biosynthesis-associated methylase
MHSERQRLEELWAGPFGDAYIERNLDAHANRQSFWSELVQTHEVTSALEVGCNVGGNLLPLAGALGIEHVAGVDVNDKALSLLRERLPGINAQRAAASRLPFPDRAFDLAFTMGVLIHQPDESLGQVMDEVVRCSSRLVFCCEYYAEEAAEVPYRGEQGALFKRDYGRLYRERFPTLSPVDEGSVGPEGGWDVANWWLFERRG